VRFGVDVCRPSDHEEMQRVETIGEQAKRFDEGLSPARLAAPLGWLGINVLSWVGIVDESFPFLLSLVLPLLMWQSLREMVRCVAGCWRRALLAAGVTLVVNFLIVGQAYQSVVVPLIGRSWSLESISSVQNQLSSQVSESAVFAVAACLLGPVVEELVFRYAVLRSLLSISGFLGQVVSAALFALFHVGPELLAGDYCQLIPGVGYFASGLCYGLCYMKTGNLSAPLLAHILNNMLSIVWIVS